MIGRLYRWLAGYSKNGMNIKTTVSQYFWSSNMLLDANKTHHGTTLSLHTHHMNSRCYTTKWKTDHGHNNISIQKYYLKGSSVNLIPLKYTRKNKHIFGESVAVICPYLSVNTMSLNYTPCKEIPAW